MIFKRKSPDQVALEALQDVGIKKGDTVFDCCCGCGHYTMPASQLVGKEGLVYAIDTNKSKLQDLKKEIASGLFKNIKIIQEDVEQKISIPSHSIDVVLLYDIFWYFRPNEQNLSRLLREIYRIVKIQGLVSVFPTHIDSYQLRDFKDEMKQLGFYLAKQCRCNLVHESNIEKGEILNFLKIRG